MATEFHEDLVCHGIFNTMEQEFIQWLEQHILDSCCAQNESGSVLLGIGDDGAIVSGTDSKQVYVTDAIVDQVHFDLQRDRLEQIGHKAIAVNLSDIAAMGAIPQSALVTLVVPRSMSLEHVKQIFLGISMTAKKYQVAVVGGDTCRHDGPLMINVALTGRIDPNSKNPDGWRMDAAVVGDVLLVSGPLGGSLSGRHLNFEPRVELANAIQNRVVVHCATDVSDSLSIDLGHLIRKSNVAATLELSQVPVTAAATEMSPKSGKSPLQHALGDGEDFELLLTMSSAAYSRLLDDASFKFDLYPVGAITTGPVGEILDSATGNTIDQVGYCH